MPRPDEVRNQLVGSIEHDDMGNMGNMGSMDAQCSALVRLYPNCERLVGSIRRICQVAVFAHGPVCTGPLTGSLPHRPGRA